MTKYNTIKIFAPRFSHRDVVIAPWHVQQGMNRIVFTKTWKDKVLLMDGAKIATYPMTRINDNYGGYAVPIKDFEVEDYGQMRLEVDNAEE